MTRWQTCPELNFLLETLGKDIIAATDDEVREVHGKSIAATAREVRRLVQAARGDDDGILRAELGEASSAPNLEPRPTKTSRRPAHQQQH